jgi:hypothetical protein
LKGNGSIRDHPKRKAFASVQNCETYPLAVAKNKQALKNKVVSARCMDVKYNKNLNYIFFSAKEILNKVSNKRIMIRLIKNITRPLQSQHN